VTPGGSPLCCIIATHTALISTVTQLCLLVPDSSARGKPVAPEPGERPQSTPRASHQGTPDGPPRPLRDRNSIATDGLFVSQPVSSKPLGNPTVCVEGRRAGQEENGPKALPKVSLRIPAPSPEAVVKTRHRRPAFDASRNRCSVPAQNSWVRAVCLFITQVQRPLRTLNNDPKRSAPPRLCNNRADDLLFCTPS